MCGTAFWFSGLVLSCGIVRGLRGKETACSLPPESLSMARSAATEIVQADLSKNGASAKYACITNLHSRSCVVQVFCDFLVGRKQMVFCFLISVVLGLCCVGFVSFVLYLVRCLTLFDNCCACLLR